MTQMGSMRPDAAIHALVLQPLEVALDKVLLSVGYWLMDFDKPAFNVETPNASGLCAISMVFGDDLLEILPGWDHRLRGATAYHIETRFVSGSRANHELARSARLAEAPADRDTLWRNAIGHALTGVEVYGIGAFPHLIRFIFASTKITVAIGYSGDPPLIGDGDEILVFSDDDWLRVQRTLPDEWTKIWEHGGSEGDEWAEASQPP